jgi:hypothetical protein
VRNSNPRNQGRIYEFEIVLGYGIKRIYIADHKYDPLKGPHFDIGVPKPGADVVNPGGRYTKVGGPILYQ